jgi:hypothetical protein
VKAVKISVRPGGAVHAAVELLVPGFEAFRAVLPRALDALGVARSEFHAGMRVERKKLVDASGGGAEE